MSPEQFQAEGVDGRTDIYALGIVLYELTVGRLPFRPQQLMEAFRMHTQEPVPLPGSIRPNFPRLLEKVILKCLAKRPDERYQTAKELANVLGRLQLDLENGHATDPRPEAEQTDIGTEPVPFTLSQVAAPETALERDSIVIYSQGQPPRIVPISKPVMLIGRESGKDIVLADRLVSREHAQVERKADGTYWIKDLGSTNSSVLGDARLEANTPEEWMYGQTVRIGSFALRLQPGSVPQVNVTEPQQRVPSPIMATEPQNSAAYALSQIPFTEPQNGEQQPSFRLTGVNIQAPNQPIMVVMSPANVKVNPGETAEVRVEVSNRGFSADDLMLEVRGVPGDWAEIAAPALQVTPGASIVTTIAFTPPRQWTSRAGRHTYTLRVHSAAQQMEVAKLTGVLHVAAFQNFTASLHPRRIYERGVTTLTIANEGNAAADFVLQARDRENGLYFDLESTHVSVEPGQSETVRLEVAPRPSALVHGAKLMPFEVRVKAADGESRAAPGELLAVANLAGQQPVGAVVPVQPELAPVPPPDVIPAPIVVPSLQSTERERGGCLTLWLLLHSAFALLLIPTIVVETFVVGFLLSLNAESSGIFVLLLGLSWLLALVYGVTLIYAWNWRAWAVYLLMFLSFFLIPVGPFLTLVWWLLVRNKRSMFS